MTGSAGQASRAIGRFWRRSSSSVNFFVRRQGVPAERIEHSSVWHPNTDLASGCHVSDFFQSGAQRFDFPQAEVVLVSHVLVEFNVYCRRTNRWMFTRSWRADSKSERRVRGGPTSQDRLRGWRPPADLFSG